MKRCLLLSAMALVVLGVGAQEDKGFEISKNLEIFANVYKNIHQYYVDDVDPGKTMKKAIDAMLSSLDPYTNYYPESDMEDVRLQLMGQYGGIGALIQQQGKDVFISEPYQGLPADRAGLRAGDKIVSIDGQSAEGKKNSDVSSALRGQAGTSVTIGVERDGKVIEKTIMREEIQLKAVPYYGYVETDFGYVKLNEFTQGSGAEVRTAVQELISQRPGLKGIILDLRGNGGGLMNEAVDIVNIFVKKGETVVETKGKVASKNITSRTRRDPVDTSIPVAVLIDGYSASASEIVSGSLQDFDRAVIIGSRSYGKGLVQNILPMAYNCQMKVTVSKYFIPSGRCIQALDYSHKDENGRATKVPDSLKTAFQTRNGRTVYDGFGIEPDVETKDEFMSGIAASLLTKFHIFNYATHFVKQHDTIAPPSRFEITDEIYSDFVNYLSDKDYTYTTITEKMIKELKKVAEEEQYLQAIETDLTAMEQKFTNDKKEDLYRYKGEISDMLKSELLTRYYYERGRTEGMITTDKDVQKAVEVMRDVPQYNKLLHK
ncbi:MAG: S41 family peptidase [Bacteroidales bacterium]|nr:S41 family peptidase [Candidatus Colimorpha onthohippi]